MQKIEFEELPSEVQTKLNGLFSESSSLKSVLKPLIKICDEFPGFVFGRLELSVVYMELNDPEEALKNYQSILSDFPGEPAAIAGIATAYAELSELAKAESFANQALEMEYHWPPLYLVLAKVYEQKSKFDDAADSYISAYRLSPNFISGLENYCRLKKLDYQSPEQNVKPPMKRKKLNDLAAFIESSMMIKDASGNEQSCNLTFRFTEHWARLNDVDIIKLYQYLNANNAFCDSDVLECFD